MRGRLSACPAQAGRLEKTGSGFAGIQYVENLLEPRTPQMPADRVPQYNGITRTDS